MKKLTLSLIATGATLALTAQANAFQDKEIAFKFNRSAPIESTYADIKAASKAACKPLLRGRNLSMRINRERNCRQDLTDKLVAAVGIDALIAMHEENTGRSNRRRFAKL